MIEKHSHRKWGVFSILILGLAAVAVSLMSMKERMEGIGAESATGPIWFTTGVEFDMLRLQTALMGYSLGGVEADSVRTHFDILWSRVSHIQRGAVAEKLIEYDVDMAKYEQVMTALKDAESQVLSLDATAADRETAEQLALMFDQFHTDLRSISLTVLQQSISDANEMRGSLLGMASAQIYLSMVIGGAVILLIIVFILDSVWSVREFKEKDALLHKAQAADIAKSQFVSVVNHELRTPLTSIKASLALLNSGAIGQVPEKFRRLLDIAERNCNHLTTLVKDLLDAEKLTSGTMKYDFEAFDLSKAIEEDIDDYQSYAKAFDVEILAKGIEPGIKIHGDRGRLGQVMSNLLSNAAKFSVSGSAVEVRLTTRDDRAVISVTDSGRGIPENERSHIFDRFHQVDTSSARERGGTGLGLSIVKAIVEAHKGEVTVESEMGKGSTFYVNLPLERSA